MQYISLIGILLALALIIFGAMKSINLIIVAPIAAMLVAFTGGMNPLEGYALNYMKGFGQFIMAYFPVFLGGALLGKVLEISGLADAVGQGIVKKFGQKNIVTAIGLATAVMVIAGVNTFVIIFTMYPMAVAFFRPAGIPKKLIPACVLGPSVVAQMLPGTTQMQNIIPAEKLGVTAMSAPITGFFVFFVLMVLCFWYLNREAKKCIANGDPFDSKEDPNKPIAAKMDTGLLPNPWITILPVGTVIVLLNVLHVPAFASLFAGCLVVFLILVCLRRTKGVVAAVSVACENSKSIITTAAVVGFGAIVSAVPGFQVFVEFLSKVSFGNPLIYAFIAVCILTAVTGSSSGGMTIALDTIGPKLLAMGGNPQSIARVIAITSLGLDSLPHNSAIVLTLNYCGVSHKEGYKYLFVTTVLLPLLGGCIAVLFGMIGIV